MPLNVTSWEPKLARFLDDGRPCIAAERGGLSVVEASRIHLEYPTTSGQIEDRDKRGNPLTANCERANLID